MALKLKWKNPNVGVTTIDIYRGDTINVSLATPLVTLTNGELSWVDTTALFGKTYYYVWAVNTANDRVVSRPQKIEVSDRRGPGSNILLQGNEAYGFFGTLPAADFINSTTILSVAKNTSGIPTDLIYPVWYKYSRNGKVIFVPDRTFGDVTWTSLYSAGFVYGTNDMGEAGSPQNVNQLTTFELNGDLFKVRLMRGFPDDVVWDGTTINMNTYPAVANKYAEYEDFIYPMCTLSPVRQRMVTVGDVNAGYLLPSGSYNGRAAQGVNCMEQKNTDCLRRGQGSYNYDPQTRGTLEVAAARGKANAQPWVPVVEYIGRVGEVDLTK